MRLLQMHSESGAGHIGGNLSCLDILLAIYHDVLTEFDHFVLSKGHAAGALYTALWSVGRLSDSDLKTFHRDGTLLSGHPPARGIADIPFATGSLGHGVGLAAGLALGQRLHEIAGRVICLTSDGEWNVGSTWESMVFCKTSAARESGRGRGSKRIAGIWHDIGSCRFVSTGRKVSGIWTDNIRS